MTILDRLSSLLLVGALFLLAREASAAAAVPDPREREARAACLSGDYAKGVALLSELFLDTRNPTYLYNQGRCYEQNARYEEAIARFQEYLRVGKQLGPDERAEAQKQIVDCREMLANQASPPSPVADPVAAVPPPVVPAVQQRPTPALRDPGARLRMAGIITAAAGGAGLLTGVLLNLKANSMASDLEQPNGYTDGKESDRKTYQTLSLVGYGLGAACVATGAVLYVLGVRSAGTSQVALVPVMTNDRTGVALQGAF